MSEFTKDIEVGDMITAYHAGFHVVTGVVRRFVTQDDLRFSINAGKSIGDESSALIQYRTVLTKKYTAPRSSSVKACDASFCEKLTRESIAQQRQAKLEEITAGYTTLLEIFDSNQEENA